MKLRVLQQRSPSLKQEYGYAESDYDNPIDNKPILQVLENDKWVDIPIVIEWEDCFLLGNISGAILLLIIMELLNYVK